MVSEATEEAIQVLVGRHREEFERLRDGFRREIKLHGGISR